MKVKVKLYGVWPDAGCPSGILGSVVTRLNGIPVAFHTEAAPWRWLAHYRLPAVRAARGELVAARSELVAEGGRLVDAGRLVRTPNGIDVGQGRRPTCLLVEAVGHVGALGSRQLDGWIEGRAAFPDGTHPGSIWAAGISGADLVFLTHYVVVFRVVGRWWDDCGFEWFHSPDGYLGCQRRGDGNHVWVFGFSGSGRIGPTICYKLSGASCRSQGLAGQLGGRS